MRNFGNTAAGWAYRMPLQGLYCPVVECVSIREGEVPDGILAKLTSRSLSQATVIDAERRTIGLVATATLEHLQSTGTRLERSHFIPDVPTISAEPALRELLSALKDASCGFIVAEGQEVLGLITISDLNRHPFRTYLYGVLAEVETSIARFVELACPDPWQWLDRLSEENQAHILPIQFSTH